MTSLPVSLVCLPDVGRDAQREGLEPTGDLPLSFALQIPKEVREYCLDRDGLHSVRKGLPAFGSFLQ